MINNRQVRLALNEQFKNLIQEFYQGFINNMNNIRVAAMKAVKNQFSSHSSAVSSVYAESMLESSHKSNKNLNNNYMYIRPRVEFQNNRILEPEKSKANPKRTAACPSIESFLGQATIGLQQHTLALSESKEHLHDKSSIEQQARPKKCYIPHRLQQSVQPVSSNNGAYDIIENDNCYIKSEGNKIIINPKNNHTLFSYPYRNSNLGNEADKFTPTRDYEAKHGFSCASTQNTKEIPDNVAGKKKEESKDFQTEKEMREKKTVFKTPAFLKNKNLVTVSEATQNEKDKRLNNSMPKNFKSFETVCMARDAAIHRFMEQKMSSKGKHTRKECISTQKVLKNSHSQKDKKFKAFLKNIRNNQENIGALKAGSQVSLKIVHTREEDLYVNLKVVKLLAQNGPSSVYLVIEKFTGFLYCLKKTQLKPIEENKQKNLDNPQFPNAVDYALRESKIGMNLDHPFLIKTYCTLHDQRNIYQLMEFVEGSTLHNLTRQRKSKMVSNPVKTQKGVHPIKAIKEIVTELLEGIVYLHDKKIVHRDLKPANIFISNNHAFKIGDFGCSIYDTPNDFVGTLDYVAPEIMLHEVHGTPVDMWAIGCIAYELYTGQPPFYHPKRKETIQKIVECNYDIQKIDNRQLKDFISKLLQQDPAERMSAKQAYEHSFIQESSENKIQI